jgi:hypothetical protein
MRKILFALLIMTASLPAVADKKLQGTTTLKDSQPAGIKGKDEKHQAYDLSFVADGKTYTCRTDPDKSMNAADFVVGSSVHYEVDSQKVKIKTPEGKEVDCKVVRVEAATPAPPTQ